MLPNPHIPARSSQPADPEAHATGQAELSCSGCGTKLASRVHGRMAHLVAASLCQACSQAGAGGPRRRDRLVRLG